MTGFDDLHGDASEESSSGQGVIAVGSLPVEYAVLAAEATPRQIHRPDSEEFVDDIDPEVLAAAAVELDAELHAREGDRRSGDT